MSTFSQLYTFFSKRLAPRSLVQSGGFTLIELIVVSAIIFIITGFILFQQSKFNSATLLRSLTYSVALSVRQSQVYGTSVRGVTQGSVETFASGYGVYVAMGTPSQYWLFPDFPTSGASGNGQYDSATEGPPAATAFTLGEGYVIDQVYVQVGAAAPTPVTLLTIYFRRPNPDACFSSDTIPAACAPGAPPVYSAAYIRVKSTGNNDTRSIKITKTGQIAVCPSNLPAADLNTQC